MYAHALMAVVWLAAAQALCTATRHAARGMLHVSQ